jgi:hypothetical protein
MRITPPNTYLLLRQFDMFSNFVLSCKSKVIGLAAYIGGSLGRIYPCPCTVSMFSQRPSSVVGAFHVAALCNLATTSSQPA